MEDSFPPLGLKGQGMEWLPETLRSITVGEGPSTGAVTFDAGTQAPAARGLTEQALRQKPQLLFPLTLQFPAGFFHRPIPKESQKAKRPVLRFQPPQEQSKKENGGDWHRRIRFKISSTFRLSAYSLVVRNLSSGLYSVRSKLILFSQLPLT